MPRRNPPRFRKTLLALAAGAALAPHSAWALVLATAPPGTVQPYVAPNVILSLDDSDSMDKKDMVLTDPSKPQSWSNPYTKTRTQVLKDALKEVFNDKDLFPENSKKIRLAWHSFGMLPEGGGWSGCTKVDGLTFYRLNATSASSDKYTNTMRVFDETHRANFLKYADAFTSCASTPTHWMVKGADDYMRAPLNKNGPWADKPTEQLASASNDSKPLGCRRNYHILLTDGDWNGTYRKNYPVNTSPVNFDNQDSKRNIHGKEGTKGDTELFTAFKLPDGTEYNRDDPNTWAYRDIDYPTYSSWHPDYYGQYLSTLSDWTFKSWATELQSPANLSGEISPSPEYDKALPTETFTNPKTKKTATLKKYWNPRYNPATWPHMVTFTIGFSKDSIPKRQFRPIGKTTTEVNNTTGKYWINDDIGTEWYKKKDKPLWQWDGPFLAGETWAGSQNDQKFYFGVDKDGNPNKLSDYYAQLNNGAFDPKTDNGNKGLLIPPSSNMPYGYDGSFADYAAGRAQWFSVKGGEAGQDMWHAAINGRGQFYAVEKGEDLKEAFRQIVKTINIEVDPDLSASATSGSNASRSSVGKYTASYEPLKAWKGFITADRVKSDGTTAPDPSWSGQTTADKLDAMNVANRLVLSWSDKSKGGVPFKWATDESNLSTAQKAMLGLAPAATGVTVETNGQNRLNYIRGERGLEGSESSGYTAAKPYRERKSIQGDIINSDVWYVGPPASDSLLKGYAGFVRTNKTRPGMLYVGGNDGMLHGFAAADGQEKMAYVPRGVIPTLKHLTAPAYNKGHKYFVDGTPMTGDVDLNGGLQDPKADGYDTYTPNWRTLLVGALGLGGKGYFVLDVTDPSTFATATPSSLVSLDRTRGADETAPDCATLTVAAEKTACLLAVEEDKDIGYITAKPVTDDNDDMRATQITRMNNNRWAVVLGNGYNSKNERPVLLIQYLDGDKKLVRLPATTDATGSGKAADNGLGAPRVVDLNGDGRIDIAYAGDNLGNLWKFDLTSATASNWAVAFGGAPLFTASGLEAPTSASRDQPQPISAPPTVRANDRMKTVGSGTSAKTVRVGGMMVAFGTGRNVDKQDPNKRSVQTLYSVLDNTRYREVGTGAAKRLEVHPGGGSCPSGDNCVPAPAALGAGTTNAKLAQQTVQAEGDEFGAIKPATTADELKPATWANFNGWYLDLPAVGERLLKGMKFYDASNLLTVYSQVPAKGSNAIEGVESCEATSVDAEHQYRSFVNIMDGKAPSVAVVDKNNDGKFNMADGDGVQVNGKYISISRKKVEKGPHSIIGTNKKDENVGITAKNTKEKLARLPEESLRPSWRQLQ